MPPECAKIETPFASVAEQRDDVSDYVGAVASKAQGGDELLGPVEENGLGDQFHEVSLANRRICPVREPKGELAEALLRSEADQVGKTVPYHLELGQVGARRGPPGHTAVAEQPRSRLPGGAAAGRGKPAGLNSRLHIYLSTLDLRYAGAREQAYKVCLDLNAEPCRMRAQTARQHDVSAGQTRAVNGCKPPTYLPSGRATCSAGTGSAHRRRSRAAGCVRRTRRTTAAVTGAGPADAGAR